MQFRVSYLKLVGWWGGSVGRDVATKPDYLSLILRTHVVARAN